MCNYVLSSLNLVGTFNRILRRTYNLPGYQIPRRSSAISADHAPGVGFLDNHDVRSSDYTRAVVKYLGSKRTLLPVIRALVQKLPVESVCDLFAGTTRVGQAFREEGKRVLSNDLATYSEALGLAYIAADSTLDRNRIRKILAHLQTLPPKAGYVTETFCIQSRYFRPENGARIDAIRDEIERLELDRVERGVVLTSLLEAADRVDSTCGLQMAYLKGWAPRAFNALELREPRDVPGIGGVVTRLDANELVSSLNDLDCCYIDPPYNQHSYFSNYHIWETIVRHDAPDHYGVACKRLDCRTTKSAYNSKRAAWSALEGLVTTLPTPWLIVSFNNEGFHDLGEVSALLGRVGYVATLSVDFKRYVGAQIGIHNPRGERVGTVSHLRNKETLFVVGPDRHVIDNLIDEPQQVALF
jgi:adenine-specific DNA-methyltransferase